MNQVLRANCVGLSICCALAGLAHAQTVYVDTVEDVVDFQGARRVADLPGPDGRISFREAIYAVDNTPGPQTIGFRIPKDEWWLYNDRAILKLEDGMFILRADETTVDFTTQTRYTGDTNPDGNEVGVYGLEPNGWGTTAISVTGSHCTIIGLDRVMQRGHAVQLWGNYNRVISCTISGPLHSGVYISGGFDGPPAEGNVVGGTKPGEGNVLSAGNHGVRIDTPANNNVVIGNRLSGVFAGVAVRGNRYTGSPVGNRIGGETEAERNVISGAGKYGEEGYPDGAQVSVEMAVNTQIIGNYIGTTPDGMSRAPQIGPTGVAVIDSTDTVIRGNLISGLRVAGTNHYQGQTFGQAILVTTMNADNIGTLIEGNMIGADATGRGAIPTLNGVVVAPFISRYALEGTQVGGTEPGQGNLIAFIERESVLVTPTVQGVWISGNSIHSNGRLGIELGGDGVTPNDPGDGDAGANDLQNFPIITAAEGGDGKTRVQGTLSSLPARTFSVELFASEACDPSGHGEGAEFLAVFDVDTDGRGEASFDVVVQTPVPQGHVITATATDVQAWNTSEFSRCFAVSGGLDCDAISKFAVSCKRGKLKAKVKSSLPEGTELTIDNDGDVKTLVIDGRGGGVVKYKQQTGTHHVSIVECPRHEREVACP
ncbi:MAG: hypothetical protein C4547_14415 [Phycisphaerales bacterium]|nr:MAG: hypothetical protein C4547_14415 [Phycisphaerales bacterium]